MKYLRDKWNFSTMVAILAAFVFFSTLACWAGGRSDTPIDVEATAGSDPKPPVAPTAKSTTASGTAVNGGGTPPTPTQTPTTREGSSLKQTLPLNSFDKAADANAELSRYRLKIKCTDPNSNSCKELSEKFGKNPTLISDTARNITQEQDVMADIARASDVVGVAAVGAALGSELVLKNPNQANSLSSVSKVQKVGGIAGIAAGITDIGLAGKAFFDQKAKLENLQSTLAKAEKVDPKLQQQLNLAVKKTKEAAYSHALYGAVKFAGGAISLKMSKENLKSKQTLETNEQLQLASAGSSGNSTSSFSPPAGGSGGSGSGGSGGSGGGSGGSSSLIASTATTGSGSTSAASSTPTPELKAKLNEIKNAEAKAKAGGISDKSTVASGNPFQGKKEEEKTTTATPAGKENKEILSSLEYGLGTFGRYHPSGSEGSGAPDIAGLINGILNPDAPAPGNAATGINPNALYEGGRSPANDAFIGEENAGINNSEKSLFELASAKYAQMWEQGRLAGIKGVLKE